MTLPSTVLLDPDIQRFIKASNDLANLLQGEIECVRHKDYQKIEMLQNQKYQLNALYAKSLESIKARPQFLENLDAGTKTMLIDLTAHLNQVAEENTLILQGAHESAQRILSILHEVAQKTQAKFKSYGANAIFGVQHAQTYGQSGHATTLDVRM